VELGRTTRNLTRRWTPPGASRLGHNVARLSPQWPCSHRVAETFVDPLSTMHDLNGTAIANFLARRFALLQPPSP